MEPKFQSSFIPKKPVVSTQNTAIPVAQETNIFSLVAGVMFTVAILVSAALFGYQKVLHNQILTAQQAVSDARSAFEADKIQDLIDSNGKIDSAKQLLVKHVALSKLLLLMQQLTLANVKFDDLEYTNQSGLPTLTIAVEAQSYNALASQSDIFRANEFIKSPYFTEFSPQDTGSIKAKFNSTIDTSLVSYAKAVNAMPAADNSTQQ
jgi:hypothetical protein